MSKDKMLIGSRKGLIIYKKSNTGRWVYHNTQFPGIPVSIATYDSVSETYWVFLDHGHWGNKLHRSKDAEKWEELEAPRYPEGEEVSDGVPAATRYLWAFANGGLGTNTIYIGTEPGGLFTSSDNGLNFELNRGLWDQPSRKTQWFGGGRDYAGIHSIIVDPRDSNHIYIGISCAGVFESKNGGDNWVPKNNGLWGDFLPDKFAEIGQDPHLLDICNADPDVMWQQNHCGVFRTEDGGKLWHDVSDKDGPAVFGFAIAAHQTDPNVAWVIPGVSDQIRVPVDQSLCVCRTDDGGKNWKDFRRGLPQKTSFDIVYRHAMSLHNDTLAFGTTTGNLYISESEGEKWETVNTNLPMVYSLEFC